MLDTNCPNCGAPLQFRSAYLAVKVCDYCRSTIVRRGEALENVGKAADVPEDVSPVQLGVRGRDGAVLFEIVGRVRWGYADGAWNEWCGSCPDGGYLWLSEASGRWMLLRETPNMRSKVAKAIAAGQPVQPGADATIDGNDYIVSDVQSVSCIGSEGELPFPTPIGTTAISVDLQRGDGLCASIQNDGGAVSIYTGRYVSLAEIGATGLRAFDGWPMPRFAA